MATGVESMNPDSPAPLISVLILVWTLTPIYNIIMVALEAEGDVSVTHIFPPQPSVESFWVVITEGHWYLEAFWHQFGNSVFLAAMVTLLTLAIGSLTSTLTAAPRARSRGPSRCTP